MMRMSHEVLEKSEQSRWWLQGKIEELRLQHEYAKQFNEQQILRKVVSRLASGSMLKVWRSWRKFVACKSHFLTAVQVEVPQKRTTAVAKAHGEPRKSSSALQQASPGVKVLPRLIAQVELALQRDTFDMYDKVIPDLPLPIRAGIEVTDLQWPTGSNEQLHWRNYIAGVFRVNKSYQNEFPELKKDATRATEKKQYGAKLDWLSRRIINNSRGKATS
jgi:hypothetical protein